MSVADVPCAAAGAPLRLLLSSDALVANWRWLAARSGAAACGAAVKADGYGLGAVEVARRLGDAGCRDFFVATWAEAVGLSKAVAGAGLSVLHGIRTADLPAARAIAARPVLNSIEQVALWRASGGGPCDVMVDTGMNRLGLSPTETCSGALDGLAIDTLMSHLACADEDVAMNGAQLASFRAVVAAVPARRASLANSAGICLGSDYGFDLTRPGLALYGGIPRSEAAGNIRPVATPQAEVLQMRDVPAGATVGYNATWTAPVATRIAIVNLGYADGYPRALSNLGSATVEGRALPLVGRVSMDLIALDATQAPALAPGDWVGFDFDLGEIAVQSGRSQYELLTGLGARFDRVWTG